MQSVYYNAQAGIRRLNTAQQKAKYNFGNQQNLAIKMGGVEGYMDEMDAAKAANESRYGQIVSGIDGDIASYGKNLDFDDTQRKDDATSYYNGQQAKGLQGLNSKGFAGTTVMPTMKMGYGRGLNKELNRISEGTFNRKFQLERDKNSMRKMKYGVMERRTDAGPNASSYGL